MISEGPSGENGLQEGDVDTWRGLAYIRYLCMCLNIDVGLYFDMESQP